MNSIPSLVKYINKYNFIKYEQNRTTRKNFWDLNDGNKEVKLNEIQNQIDDFQNHLENRYIELSINDFVS